MQIIYVFSNFLTSIGIHDFQNCFFAKDLKTETYYLNEQEWYKSGRICGYAVVKRKWFICNGIAIPSGEHTVS